MADATEVFQVGDIVALKSGSNPLTVIAAGQEESQCQWWNSAKEEMCKEWIKNIALVKTDDDSNPEITSGGRFQDDEENDDPFGRKRHNEYPSASRF